jgi:hypothetical protein
MTIHVLVEGPSEHELIAVWTDRLQLHPSVSVRVHPHQGKGTLPKDLAGRPDARHRGLLDQLPAKLRGFENTAHPTDSVLVLVDVDDDDCADLRTSIVSAVQQCAPKLQVEVRIAVEETEALYLGDLHGIKSAFPRANMALARAYEPDSICGTWEHFGRVVNDLGGNKVAWAEAMGPVLTTVPTKSRSPSFQALIRALRRLETWTVQASAAATPRPRRWRHVAKNKRGRRT